MDEKLKAVRLHLEEGFSLALASDGKVSWGYNGDGELGDNSTSESHVPVADPDDLVVKIEVYVDNVLIASSVDQINGFTSPSNLLITPPQALSVGAHSVKVIVYDQSGITGQDIQILNMP